MPGPFDTTTRYLVQTYPSDWLAFLGEQSPVTVVDSNLSTVSAEVDKVLRVEDAEPWLLHLEFQSTYDAGIGRRLTRYNAMLHDRHEDPVESILVLLRQSADGPAVTGEYHVARSGRRPRLSLSYNIRRIWQEPVSDLLAGALGTLPLAPLSAVDPGALPDALRVLERRIDAEANRAEASRLRVVTYTLLGLRYPSDIVDQLMPGMRDMRDSSTYQAILEEGRVEGRVEEARELLLDLGTRRFGPPDAAINARLGAIMDHGRLHALAARLFDAADWPDLLNRPQP